MNDKKIFLKKAAGVLLAALAAAAIFCLLINLSIIRNAESKTISLITPEEASITENKDGSVGIGFVREDGVYINKLSFNIDTDDGRPARIRAEIICLENGSEAKTYVYEDINPLYIENEVININKENIVNINITGFGSDETSDGGHIPFEMANFRIDNRPNISPAALLFFALLGAAISSILLFRDELCGKPEYAFLIICLAVGISMVNGLPKTKVGYDEETHMQSVFALASFPSGELHFNDAALNQVLITEYNNPEALPGTIEESEESERRLSELCDYRQGGNTPNFKLTASRIPAYVVMAAGVKAAKLFHPGWSTIIFIMRLSNLIMYAALMFFAIKLVPCGKWLMFFIALLPENIFMACTCSYDPFVIGCLSVGYALMLKGRKYLILMLVFFILGCMPKAVYIPAVLLGTAVCLSVGKKNGDNSERKIKENSNITEKRNKEDSGVCAAKKKACSINKKTAAAVIAGMLVVLLFMALFILPTVIAPPDTGDLRGGEVSALKQVRFILSSPLAYAAILFRQMFSWLGQCWFGADCMTFMGHIVNGYTKFKGYYAVYMPILAAGIILSHSGSIGALLSGKPDEVSDSHTASDGFTGQPRQQKNLHQSKKQKSAAGKFGTENGIIPHSSAGIMLSLKLRLWMLLMVFCAAVLVWTAMYVAFTVPGAPEIAGVQGRYFIPLMFPAYFALCGSSETPFLARKTSVCYYLLELLPVALTVFRCVISAFCL